MLRKCFEMSTPLRAMNKNKYFIVGNLISMVVNIVMLFLLFKLLGFIGPAIAYVVTEFSSLVYLSIKIISTYKIKLSQMLLWKKSGIILLGVYWLFACFLCRRLFNNKSYSNGYNFQLNLYCYLPFNNEKIKN